MIHFDNSLGKRLLKLLLISFYKGGIQWGTGLLVDNGRAGLVVYQAKNPQRMTIEAAATAKPI